MMFNKFDAERIWAKNCQLIIERDYLRKEIHKLSKIILNQDMAFFIEREEKLYWMALEAQSCKSLVDKDEAIQYPEIDYLKHPAVATCGDSIDGLCHTELLPCTACPTPKDHIHVYIAGNPNCVLCGSKTNSLPNKENKNHAKD